MTTALVNQLIMILLLTAAGYGARKLKIMDGKVQSGLSALVIKTALPATILASANKPFDTDRLSIILMIFAGGLGYHILAILLGALLGKAVRLPKGKAEIFTLLVAFTNVAFIGFPIMSVFLPENGVFYASIFTIGFNLIFYTYGIAKVSGVTSLSPRTVLANPALIASLVMIVMYLAQIKLPVALQSTLEMLGGLCTPLSMLVIGGMLAGVHLRELFTTPLLYLVSLVRLALLPTLIFAAVWLLTLPTEAAVVLLVMGSLPSASTTAIAAQLYGNEPEFASKGVMQSNIFFALSITYTSWLVSML